MTSPAEITERYVPLKVSNGTAHPFQVYGTAFKEGRTGELTTLALKTGFTAYDMANYPSAYEEAMSGEAIQKALKSGVDRKSLFIQTKFTPAWAHQPGKLPYNPDQPIEGQARESIEQSFKNLQVDYIDSLMIHVPYDNDQDTLKAWRVMESYVPKHIGVLGVSNFGLSELKNLYEAATVKPEIVQNRFQEQNGYDHEIRAYLQEKGIIYQGFSLLKANSDLRSSEVVQRVAAEFGVAKEIAFYLLVLGLGKFSIVNGTTNEDHMRMDLDKISDILGNSDKVKVLIKYLAEFEHLLSKK
ncbi:hypothetical protein O1611_g1776 [Lasiodiplodia mahajangana]|uniref:Uncharacterized protein n=1 Tax=Lasiodiplodia mahajangana TaxID=1108764 RepID=A0ACC2JX40_9PEZI|nr:hypothetical protein O1611_g1776 [Lasiodiplodia mahajangana]